MFRCENLTFKVKNTQNSYTFCAKKGKITVILGLNGCGKTTLLKNIIKIQKPLSGELYLNDNLITNGKRTISYMPQKIRNISDISAQKYVLTGRTPYIKLFSNPSKKDIIITEEMLKLCNADNFQNRSINSLSGGELASVMLAKLLAWDTQVMLLDEPCAFLDFRATYDVLDMLCEYVKQKEKIALMTMHDPSLALCYADSIIFLDNNGVFRQVDDLNDLELLETCFKHIYGPIKIKLIDDKKILIMER